MLTLILFHFIIEHHVTVSQFPNHVDVQKVGVFIVDDKKYNVLKPSLHVVTDYFKDFMLRRENKDYPTKRIFIDKNGFRHFWSSFEDDKVNLRKFDIISDVDITKLNTDTPKDSIYTTTTKRFRNKKKKRVYSMPFLKKLPGNTDELLREGAKERTMATTTFFCPFFGVITMNAFID